MSDCVSVWRSEWVSERERERGWRRRWRFSLKAGPPKPRMWGKGGWVVVVVVVGWGRPVGATIPASRQQIYARRMAASIQNHQESVSTQLRIKADITQIISRHSTVMLKPFYWIWCTSSAEQFPWIRVLPLSIYMSEGYGNVVLGNAQAGDLIQSHIEVITTSGDVIEIDLPSTSTIKEVKCTLQTMSLQPMYCSKLIWGDGRSLKESCLVGPSAASACDTVRRKDVTFRWDQRRIAGNGGTWRGKCLRFRSSHLGPCRSKHIAQR